MVAKICTVLGTSDYFNPSGWCYGSNPICGDKTWGSICQTGRVQSPIDLPDASSLSLGDTSVHLTHASFQGFKVENNGVNAEIFATADDPKRPVVKVRHSGNSSEYHFDSINFHWGSSDDQGSEHAVEGNKFPLEGHLIFYRSDFSDAKEAMKATTTQGALLALTVLWVIDPTIPEGQHSPALETLMQEFKSLTTPSERELKEKLRICSWFKGQTAYFYYGSLAVPDCAENVLFVVWVKPGKISTQDLLTLRAMQNKNGKPLGDNFR